MVGRVPRGRILGLALSAALVASLGGPSVGALANDGGLRSKQHGVARKIDSQKADLGEVSAQLVRANAVLQAAQGKLTRARSDLARARARVSSAAVSDRRAAAALDEALARLVRVRRAAVSSRADEVRQREQVAALAVQQFQGTAPQLMGLSVILGSARPQDVSNQLTAVDTVLNAGASSLDSLTATRVLLAEQQKRVAAVKRQVAERRKTAAAVLVRRQRARWDAAVIENRVADLVSKRQAARSNALQQVAKERRRLADLRAERLRIERLLQARARQQAKAAAPAPTPTTTTDRSGGPLSAPVDGSVTSPYGMRMHPILLVWKLHDGVDLSAGCGTPVRAAADGTVIQRYYDTSYGNRVILDNGVVNGISLSTSYNHMEGFSTYVGQRVKRGDVIGFAGTTGLSTGCHLHFMVYENGATVDPMSWL